MLFTNTIAQVDAPKADSDSRPQRRPQLNKYTLWLSMSKTYLTLGERQRLSGKSAEQTTEDSRGGLHGHTRAARSLEGDYRGIRDAAGCCHNG
jgi:hypothetical protein